MPRSLLRGASRTACVCIVNSLEPKEIPIVDLMEVKKMLWKTQAVNCYLNPQKRVPTKFEQLSTNILAIQNDQNKEFLRNLNYSIQVFETNFFRDSIKKLPSGNLTLLKTILSQNEMVKESKKISLLWNKSS